MQPLSVSQFVEFVNTAFSTAVFPEGAAIEGEIAEYRVSQGKWIWFLLKDENSVVSCFATTWQLRMPLEDGMQVRVHGYPKVHPKSGKFSINVERVEPIGEGALRRAFELLKKKLEAEGLFDIGRKRALPKFPERIGLIASRESAAYSDFVRILGNRWGGVEIALIHVQVQGRDAVGDIVGAFRYFNDHPDLVDVIVLTRGGGSLEDLQAFNSEEVARAVFGAAVPVIVGVGHERDESLADYVADVRASTPSNAAERLVPDRRDVLAVVASGERHLGAAMAKAIEARKQLIVSAAFTLDRYVAEKISACERLAERLRHQLELFSGTVAARQVGIKAFGDRLSVGWRFMRERIDARLSSHERLLRAADPQLLLKRGYAVVRVGGRLLRDAAAVDTGDIVDIQLAKGSLDAKVVTPHV